MLRIIYRITPISLMPYIKNTEEEKIVFDFNMSLDKRFSCNVIFKTFYLIFKIY